MTDPGLYIIMTNPKIGYQAFMELCIEEELPIVQLRDKNLCDAELLALAKNLASISAGTKTSFVVNDRADIAFLSGADGLHLGQDDLSSGEALGIWGRNRSGNYSKPLIGLSTHSPTQAAAALRLKPDYIGYGPIFPTPTKTSPDPAVGLAHIKAVTAMACCPVICIGGLFPENAETVLAAGAKNLCMVRYFNDSTVPRQRVIEIRSLVQHYNKEKS